MKGKGGFTLLELIVVLIILGVIAAMGIPLYLRNVEKFRGAEALNILGALKDAEVRYYQEHNTFYAITSTNNSATIDGYALDTGFHLRYWDIYAIMGSTGDLATSVYIIARRNGVGAGNLVGCISIDITDTDLRGNYLLPVGVTGWPFAPTTET